MPGARRAIRSASAANLSRGDPKNLSSRPMASNVVHPLATFHPDHYTDALDAYDVLELS
ncbi:hypothetical protein GCM10009679_02860 [Saccharothrix algeriensis]|uniref:Uncharacterized protein n=1 Tax=Catellatospora bangladeshensis TaxID=310355 RepID=A0A8J3JMS2_9ACTN|nr:hypothetical protein Cba03nite_21430 [Catellatospora bangladeshensis]